MIFKIRPHLLIITCLVCVLITCIDCKRGGGGRRGGTSRGSSSVWSKSRQSQSGSNYDLYGSNRSKSKSQLDAQSDVSTKTGALSQTPKASAPPNNKDAKTSSAAFLEQERKHDVQPKPIGFEQQNKNTPILPQNNQQRPIGWNVNQDTGSINKNTASNLGSNPSNTFSNVNNPPAYPSHTGPYPSTGTGSNYGTGQYNYGNPPAYNNPHQTNPGYYHPSNGGVMPPQGANMGLYGNQMGGGGQPSMFGGNPYGSGYGGQSNGMFGGNNYRNMGYGGYGGYGGFGGNGMGGYGTKFGGGFGSGFGSNAYRNIAIGLLVWNLVSGFTRRPYYVYNYYNNPEKVPEEIPLPANSIVLCPENITSLCAPNTASLCTATGSILCVVLAQQTIPCDDNSTLKCANTTVTCQENDGNCSESKNVNATSVNVPCITNATITGKLSTNSAIPFTSTGDTTNLCVTTMAVPQPEEDIKKTEGILCNSNSTQAANMTCGENVTDSPVGDIFNSTVAVSIENNQTYPLAM